MICFHEVSMIIFACHPNIISLIWTYCLQTFLFLKQMWKWNKYEIDCGSFCSRTYLALSVALLWINILHVKSTHVPDISISYTLERYTNLYSSIHDLISSVYFSGRLVLRALLGKLVFLSKYVYLKILWEAKLLLILRFSLLRRACDY